MHFIKSKIRLLVKAVFYYLLRMLFRVEVKGIENYKKAGNRILVIANHVSLIDAVLLPVFISEDLKFAINDQFAVKWYLKPFFWLVRVFPINPTNPMSVKTIIKELRQDNNCVIFPEGRITVTGSMMKVYTGPAMVAEKSNATILPIHIEGAQYSIFSYLKGKVKIRLFPKITLSVLEPRKIEVDEKFIGRQRNQISGLKLYDIMCDLQFEASNINSTIYSNLIDAANANGKDSKILEDINFKPLTYSQFIARTFILGELMSKATEDKENVGLLMPNVIGTMVGFFALNLYNRVPVMLNFSAGTKNIISACKTAQVKTIYTSKKFIEQAKLEAVIDGLNGAGFKVIFLEKAAEEITIIDKIKGVIKGKFAKKYFNILNNQTYDDTAVILFTSGSEGAPKGVALSHKNLLSNCAQLAARCDFNNQDIVFNALPLFHSFGLTACALLPILNGIKCFLYPSPLHYRVIPELVYDKGATILFGTDTFLAGYAKFAHPYDFYSLRYVFAGAEKLKPQTRDAYIDKFGIRVLEGYGATETSPALTFNNGIYNQFGSVGRFLPAIKYELKKEQGINEGKRLFVKGPNIMKGYIFEDNPGVIEPLENGLYDTGDIVDIDDNGFVKILGRAKRFAKIGGEMVSLTAVESCINDLYPGFNHAVIAIDDARKGEALLLISDFEKIDKTEIRKYFKENEIAEINLPKKVEIIDKMLVTGSGKIDYITLKENYG